MQWSSVELDRGVHRASARARRVSRAESVSLFLYRDRDARCLACFSSERRTDGRGRARARAERRDAWHVDDDDTSSGRALCRFSSDRRDGERARSRGGIRGFKLTTRTRRGDLPRRLPLARQLARLLISVIYGQLSGRARARCVWFFVIYTKRARQPDAPSERGSTDSEARAPRRQ